MHYFFLGHTPALGILELQSLFPGNFKNISSTIVETSTIPDSAFFKNLGGTKKIAESRVVTTPKTVISDLAKIISSLPNKNIAITDYAQLNLSKAEIRSIKDIIERSIRFVSLETNEHELVMLSKQHVAELNMLRAGDELIIAHTTWIFDADDWVRRDRAKPYRDIKRGMLPPKLARILVNLALRGSTLQVLADPFCGTGTILAEALLSGAKQVYGSDTNPQAIDGSRANLSWLCTSYSIPDTKYSILNIDATHLDEIVPTLDCIATEPYMGPLLEDSHKLQLSKIQDIAKGLDKLYRGCFKAWAKVLKPGGRVVMTIPSFAVYGRVIPTISIDTLTALGYNYISTVPYGKPGAVVIRNITILEKK